MDRKLIDTLLIELLKLPEESRSPEKILANLTLAATAAGVSLTTTPAPLQIEHLQLAAALDSLAIDLGSNYRARATLRLGHGLEGVELGAVLEPLDSSSTLPRFVAFGATASTTLAGINRDVRASNQPQAKPGAPRKAGRLHLSSLRAQVDKANPV